MGKPTVTNVAPGNDRKTAADVAGDNIALGGAIGEPQMDPAMTFHVKGPKAESAKEPNNKKASETGVDEATTYFKDPNDRKQAWKSSDTLPGDCNE